jgi:hypothetical protein
MVSRPGVNIVKSPLGVDYIIDTRADRPYVKMWFAGQPLVFGEGTSVATARDDLYATEIALIGFLGYGYPS